MPNPEIGKHASQGGKAAAKRRLTLERVERELPPLDSVETAMLRLDRIGLWAAAGMLTGSVAGAIVRSSKSGCAAMNPNSRSGWSKN